MTTLIVPAVAGNAAATSPPGPTPVASALTLANYRASLLQLSGQLEQQLIILGRHEPTVAKTGAAGKVTVARRQIRDMTDKQLAVLYQATAETPTLTVLPQAFGAVTKDAVAHPLTPAITLPSAPTGPKTNAITPMLGHRSGLRFRAGPGRGT